MLNRCFLNKYSFNINKGSLFCLPFRGVVGRNILIVRKDIGFNIRNVFVAFLPFSSSKNESSYFEAKGIVISAYHADSSSKNPSTIKRLFDLFFRDENLLLDKITGMYEFIEGDLIIKDFDCLGGSLRFAGHGYKNDRGVCYKIAVVLPNSYFGKMFKGIGGDMFSIGITQIGNSKIMVYLNDYSGKLNIRLKSRLFDFKFSY